MEFVNQDRSRDSEFTRGLQNYNQQVFFDNSEIAAQIDKSKGDLQIATENAAQVADLANLKTSSQLGGIAAGGAARVAGVGKALGAAKSARLAAEVASNRAGERGAGAAVRSGTRAAETASEAARVGGGAAEVGTSAVARAAAPAAERAGGEALAETGGKILAKGALVAAKGAGLAGSAFTAGSAIYGLAEGKKFKTSEQGAEIGGAILDVIGTGLEFIPGGQLFGLGFLAAGTALSAVGSVNEALDTEPEKEKEVGKATDIQAKEQTDLEAQKRQAVLGVSSAAQGGAAVGRQIQ
tara:strand:+ start:3971 stop:4858 length:888 start_codon:yes stop_codon:yes gene_type:complete